ncbi:MBL fold metallo-hydrolase [Seongchinamella sediminis]|nr:MBL fold metallo-hydrolase [Seongchinamella sediminis]
MKKRFTILIASLTLLLAAAWGYLFGYSDPPVDPAWELAPAETIPEGALTVRFAGTSTLLFDDGDTAFLFDGWFSRPGPLEVLLQKIAPDLDNIHWGLQRMQIDTLAAVIPLHSHYDHAMDTPAVAERTGATVYGSGATANICRGWGLPEKRIALLSDRAMFQLGQFEITPIVSTHFAYPDARMRESLLENADIPEPLIPPASAFDYKLGKAYIFHVAHPQGSFLVVGSAGFVPGQLAGMDVDVLFLGTGGIGSQTADYREQFWAETAGQVRPERVIPVHWDSLTGPLDGPLTGEVRIARLLAGSDEAALAFLRAKESANPDVEFATLPRFDPVVLFP